MTKNKISVFNFETVILEGALFPYYSYKLEDGTEICLEACMNGFDVAIYNKNENLLRHKECTNMLPNIDNPVCFRI